METGEGAACRASKLIMQPEMHRLQSVLMDFTWSLISVCVAAKAKVWQQLAGGNLGAEVTSAPRLKASTE